MRSESLGFRLKKMALVNATLDRLINISGIKKIECVFPDASEPDLMNLFTAKVKKSKLNSALKELSADKNVKEAWIHPPRKLCES